MKNMPRFTTLATLFLSLALAGSVPSGMELIFKNVEPGQRFHPFWPPVSGKQILGTVVIAKNPGKPQAYFQTIDSPSYRNPTYTKAFVMGELPLNAPDLTSEKQISADVAFSQLDSIGKALSKTASSDSLQGNASAPTVSCQSATPKTGNSGGTTTPAPASNASGVKTDGKKNATSTATAGKSDSSGAGNSPAAGNTGQSNAGNSKPTGVDFCRFTNATSKVTGLKVVYYDLPVLNDLTTGMALLPSAQQLIKKGSSGWIIHRALVIDSIEYSLTANAALDAGFFAKLVAWLPTISVGYKSQTTVTLKTTSPLTIGYKLWQPGLGVEGKAVMDRDDLPKLGLGSDAIDTLLKTGTH